MEENHLRAAPLASRERLERLSAGQTRHINLGYSTFIKRMKIILPLAAISIIAVLLSWNNFHDDTIVQSASQQDQNKAITKNQLINPRFDSVDEKGQPFTITAQSATQTDSDKDLMLLDQPLADMSLNNGSWIAIRSDKGAYKQEAGHLLLTENVTLYHDSGYRLNIDQLDVDLNVNNAWSNALVTAQGPKAMLDAKGLKADNQSQTLIFKGPAKLILFDAKGAI